MSRLYADSASGRTGRHPLGEPRPALHRGEQGSEQQAVRPQPLSTPLSAGRPLSWDRCPAGRAGCPHQSLRVKPRSEKEHLHRLQVCISGAPCPPAIGKEGHFLRANGAAIKHHRESDRLVSSLLPLEEAVTCAEDAQRAWPRLQRIAGRLAWLPRRLPEGHYLRSWKPLSTGGFS